MTNDAKGRVASLQSATCCTFDMALVDDPFEQGLLVHAAPVHPVPKGVLGHDPVDMGRLLLPKSEDARNCLRTQPLIFWQFSMCCAILNIALANLTVTHLVVQQQV